MRIVFVALPGGKPFNGATIYNEPLGGSESAVVYGARALARAGHHVTVWSHGEPGYFDGVLYRSIQAGLNIPGSTEVVVVSRWLEVLPQLTGDYLKVLWIHDMPTYDISTIVPYLDAVFTISQYQAYHWGLLDHPKGWLTSDGVDLDLFRPPLHDGIERDPNRLVWVSNPDRGLPVAARIFQTIRRRWPDFELHVFGRSAVYGWDAAAERPYLPHPDFMENVYLHDPLPRAQLAEELRRAWAMFYPTWWPEVFCMAALEAQACGTPVLCSPMGALNETVPGGVRTHDFLNGVSQLRNPNKYKALSRAGIEHAQQYDWNSVMGGWVEVFGELQEARK